MTRPDLGCPDSESADAGRASTRPPGRTRAGQRRARRHGIRGPAVGRSGGGGAVGRHPLGGRPRLAHARVALSRLHGRRTRRGTATRGRSVPLRGGQRGSITAETAVALPALVIVLAVALWGVSASAAQIACLDAARAGARAAARGEPQPEVRAAVLRAAPPNARVLLSRDETTTRVVVEAQADSPLRGLFPALKLEAQAITATEPQPNAPGPPTSSDTPPTPTETDKENEMPQ
ncbi:TadE family type IV pilus minor pilin [Actinoallomurus acaciae]|uniref:TadE family type IV pilus minor pilin n=1 Tax=Actinoallomurus acaciae TaxID=502577 RepID=A0ABV5YE32_9ACTN